MAYREGPGMKCCREGCAHEASYRLSITLRPSAGPHAAYGDAQVMVCKGHAIQSAADKMIFGNPLGQACIEQVFRNLGLALPDWDRCSVKWVLMDG